MTYSPILSILTAIFEISIIIWALSRRPRNKIIILSCVILFLLSLYQIFEVFVCLNQTGSLFFSHLGFLVITWLPALGLLLICFLFPYRSKFLLRFVQLMLLAAFLLNIWINSDQDFLVSSVCRIVFASYGSKMPQFLIYGAYYQLGLFAMLVTSTLGIINSSNTLNRHKLGQVLLGTTVFVFPAMLMVIALPQARNALPSILCHFALFLAVFLSRLIWLEKKESNI